MATEIDRPTREGRTSGQFRNFVLTMLAMTVAFFVVLEWTIVNEAWIVTIVVPFLYAAGAFGSGMYFGRREPKRPGRGFESGVKYHVATFLIVGVVNILFILIRHPEDLLSTLFGIGVWAIFVVTHVAGERWLRRGYRRDEVKA